MPAWLSEDSQEVKDYQAVSAIYYIISPVTEYILL